MSKQTAVELLFLEFKSLSKISRDAGDIESANLIDFLCEREQQAKEMEKENTIAFAVIVGGSLLAIAIIILTFK
jgi:hypothetical protein